jgi:hypothetical protein
MMIGEGVTDVTTGGSGAVMPESALAKTMLVKRVEIVRIP